MGNPGLYMTHDYKITDADNDLPTHYSFKVTINLEPLSDRMNRLLKNLPPTPDAVPDEKQVREIINALDARGGWFTPGTLKYHRIQGLIIDSQVFIDRPKRCRAIWKLRSDDLCRKERETARLAM